MPHSYPEFKQEFKHHFVNNFDKLTKILDVGPGAGVYGKLLSQEGYKIDCLEIWAPYVEQFNLHSIYDNVIIGDIRYFDISSYDYIIMGDVLEHLTFSDAKALLDKIEKNKIKCLVAVPYNYSQGASEGNVYETHWQPDLTPENVLTRYPSLKELEICKGHNGNPFYGYYINY